MASIHITCFWFVALKPFINYCQNECKDNKKFDVRWSVHHSTIRASQYDPCIIVRSVHHSTIRASQYDPCITVRSVHHSTIQKEKSKNVQDFIKIYYSIFIWSSTCFGRHTAHHQEPKTALAASGFSYVEGCWTLSGTLCLTTSTNYNSNTLPHMKNQRLPVQF
jgi:hypothetical protein